MSGAQEPGTINSVLEAGKARHYEQSNKYKFSVTSA